MRVRAYLVTLLLAAVASAALAAADGSWLKKVSASDRGRSNPYAGKADAVAAGSILFHNNCSHCHGENAEGKGTRPALKSDRIHNATDGEIAWILKNGEPYKGMPRWSSLPEAQRWQIVSYLRSLNTDSTGGLQ
jgi:mono/diheme cytochrome c family protein